MTGRVCDWCGTPLSADAPLTKLTCSDSHRAKRWRWLNEYGKAGEQPESPPEGSPLLGSWRLRQTRANGADRRSGSGGLQVSYRRAVEELARELWFTYTRMSKPACRVAAEGILSKALPARQRARLEARR